MIKTMSSWLINITQVQKQSLRIHNPIKDTFFQKPHPLNVSIPIIIILATPTLLSTLSTVIHRMMLWCFYAYLIPPASFNLYLLVIQKKGKTFTYVAMPISILILQSIKKRAVSWSGVYGGLYKA